MQCRVRREERNFPTKCIYHYRQAFILPGFGNIVEIFQLNMVNAILFAAGKLNYLVKQVILVS